jgi:hypothetical protein
MSFDPTKLLRSGHPVFFITCYVLEVGFSDGDQISGLGVHVAIQKESDDEIGTEEIADV